MRLFPSFEAPIDRSRYLNIEPPRRSYGGRITAVILAGVACAFVLTLTRPDAQVAPTPRSLVMAPPVVQPVRTAAADIAITREEKPANTAQLWASCAQRVTARRACAAAKAAREARLTGSDAPVQSAGPAAGAAGQKRAVANSNTNTTGTATATTALAAADAVPGGDSANAAAPRPKVKKPRPEEIPPERLVRVYDDILADGRRVPVYRRANGGYESGSVIDGEYRPGRTVQLREPRVFGLQ